MTKPKLISRQVLFGNPDKASPDLSPDGARLAFLAPVDNVLNVWVGPADKPAEARPVTRDTLRGIRVFFWAYTNQHIIYLQDEGGDENWRVYVTDVTTRETRDLTPFDTIAGPDGEPIKGPDEKPLRPMARIQEVSPRFPDEILIALNKRDPSAHDVYRANIRTGQLELVEQNDDQFLGYISDEDYAVRFAMRATRDGGTEILQSRDGKWTSFAEISQEDSLTTAPEGFNAAGDILYMQDSRGRNTAALTAIDLNTGKQTVLADNPRCDLANTLFHPRERTAQAAAFNYERREWKILDESLAPDFERLPKVCDGDFSIVSRTLDDRWWIVAYERDAGPVRYYRYSREDGQATFLFVDRARLDHEPLAGMHPRVIRSRDGLNLVSYLTLPVDADPDGDLKPERPLPMVLLVHGGPWYRDSWGYDAEHQWLANRGYAVLSVNFRGSTGFGKNFINAADKQWAASMHDDLLDAVEWAIHTGVADPKRIGIMGGSYGGYATLVGLTFTPDTFACGVDIVGPSNLVTLLESIPPYWEPQVELFTKRIGDHRTAEGRKFLLSRSPLTFADRIIRPLLIGQGANDPRVKQAEADQIVKAMQAKGIPVTYVLYPDEGHGFARPENRLSFYAVAEAFLAEHLGGRVEPIGNDFEGSTIQAPAGGEQVQGVAAALRAQR